jgi:imidazoleglycerol-phosphate dehydratase
MGREASIERNTAETQIRLRVDLDGTGKCRVETDIGFFDHMLNLFSAHSGIDLDLFAKGDREVDDHHLVEDVGIVLGQALKDALGEKRGIERYGSFILSMDEVLALCSIDLSGRPVFVSDYVPVMERIGQLSTEMVNHFFRSMAMETRMNLHFKLLNPGENEHHRVEAMFKSFAHALRIAVALDPDNSERIRSTKGTLV